MNGNLNFQKTFTDAVYSALIECMKEGCVITQLQQDISESVRVLRSAFDKLSVEERIVTNYKNHKQLFDPIGWLPSITQTFSLDEIEKYYTRLLRSQLSVMMLKALTDMMPFSTMPNFG